MRHPTFTFTMRDSVHNCVKVIAHLETQRRRGGGHISVRVKVKRVLLPNHAGLWGHTESALINEVS